MKTFRHIPCTGREAFIHRHDRFKPTLENILLVGFAAGAATVVIITTLCGYFAR